jgi:hypothetical protein
MMKPEPERDAAPAAPKVMFSMDGFKNSTNGMILLFFNTGMRFYNIFITQNQKKTECKALY